MYLVAIGWLYVVLMMSVAEATNSTGTVLGAIVTFILYGLLPLALVMYVMLTPQRRKLRLQREAANEQAQQAQANASTTKASDPFQTETDLEAELPASDPPHASGHAPGAAQAHGVAPVREKP